ncbi:M28 family peptidase [Hymenobacter sp. HDW8]|uniref:M28 family peptidase n=1 Tax=Hymenobacter sp. HDW8 TaxID=2714932 RepID=UPI00140CDF6A|nr:M28 family peptidase [Hymenobacter sp. HDW8]QIL75297.1 M28 family peptidase [Hymenobacter sp. HDW8]
MKHAILSRFLLSGSLLGLLLLNSGAATAQRSPFAGDKRSAIKEEDLKRDLFAIGGDHFRGREGGTLDELKASVWIAEQARAIGLQPAGDDGTYFQFFHIQRTRLTKDSRLNIGTHQLTHGKDAMILAPGVATINAPLIFVGTGTAAEMANIDVKGKAVAILFSGTPSADLSYRRFVGQTMRDKSVELVKAGAVAVVFVSDARAQNLYENWTTSYERGRYSLPGEVATKVVEQAPTVWLPAEALAWVRQPGQQLTATLKVETFAYPSVNIVATVPGTDAQLKKENVLFSTHQDHDGVRKIVAGDSIWNGADDNATGCAALLATMRAFKQKPAKRTALFVFHGAEERGLLGSRYYAAHPTVPRESIVAVLNAEMLGRNAPDSAALLGSQPPHRNSLGLVNTALAANQASAQFKLDTLWDKPTHPEGWYFRSDHLSYARLNIPSICYTTLLHKDYHTPEDEPERINIQKLAGVTRWIYLTGWAVANQKERPAVDKDFKLER